MQDSPSSKKIANFWAKFIAAENDTSRAKINTTVPWIRKHLDELDKRIMWELTAWHPIKRHLAFTCDGDYHVRPLVQEMVELAPSLNNWTFSFTKLPIPYQHIHFAYKTRTYREIRPSSYSLTVTPVNQIKISVVELNERKESCDEIDLLLPIEMTLGEEALEVWGGDIELSDSISQGKSVYSNLSLEDLREKYMRLVDTIIQGSTPMQPYIDQTFDKPSVLFDYDPLFDRAPFRSDVPQVTEATFHHRFWSRRYSRFNEEFCYLQFVIRNQQISDSLAKEFRETIDVQLRRTALGRTFSHGVSSEYGYIDLILSDVNEAVELLHSLVTKFDQAALGFYDQAHSTGRILLSSGL